jgi:replicative DNA helicase
LCKGVASFIFRYWQNEHLQKAPTRDAVLHEFPRFTYPDPSDESTTWLVEKVHQRHIRNLLNESMVASAELASRPDSVLDAVRKINADSWRALKLSTPRSGRVDFSETVEQRRERYSQREAFTGDIAGVPLGLPEVDRHTFGVMDGELWVIVGFAKAGKSHALCHAIVAARRAGYTPYFATLELSVNDMQDRLDAHLSGVPYEHIQKGRLTFEEAQQLRAAQDEFRELGSVFVEKLPRGERTVQYIVNRARDVGANYLVIDQLSFLEAEGSTQREQHLRISDIVNDLKLEISADESALMPCVMAAQFNRESQKNGGGKRGRLDQIALSSAVEQTVDGAISLSQTREMRANRSMAFELMGFRRGAPKAWLLAWDLDRRTDIFVREELEEDHD